MGVYAQFLSRHGELSCPSLLRRAFNFCERFKPSQEDTLNRSKSMLFDLTLDKSECFEKNLNF